MHNQESRLLQACAGIEAMFSDYKTLVFNLEDSQIERTYRLDRLVLVLSLALSWTVGAGQRQEPIGRGPTQCR